MKSKLSDYEYSLEVMRTLSAMQEVIETLKRHAIQHPNHNDCCISEIQDIIRGYFVKGRKLKNE